MVKTVFGITWLSCQDFFLKIYYGNGVRERYETVGRLHRQSSLVEKDKIGPARDWYVYKVQYPKPSITCLFPLYFAFPLLFPSSPLTATKAVNFQLGFIALRKKKK